MHDVSIMPDILDFLAAASHLLARAEKKEQRKAMKKRARRMRKVVERASKRASKKQQSKSLGASQELREHEMQESQEAAALETFSKEVNEMTQDEEDTAVAEALYREMNKSIEEIKNQSNHMLPGSKRRQPKASHTMSKELKNHLRVRKDLMDYLQAAERTNLHQPLEVQEKFYSTSLSTECRKSGEQR
uniref:Uncharacterized protein n=1 Tax=Ditylenchus dipsaci TaxID=166011 RepID=A0A915DJ57_9BILA